MTGDSRWMGFCGFCYRYHQFFGRWWWIPALLALSWVPPGFWWIALARVATVFPSALPSLDAASAMASAYSPWLANLHAGLTEATIVGFLLWTAVFILHLFWPSILAKSTGLFWRFLGFAVVLIAIAALVMGSAFGFCYAAGTALRLDVICAVVVFACAGLFVFWFTYPSWFSIRARYVWWATHWCAGWIRSRLTVGWAGLILLMVVVFAVLAVYDALWGQLDPKTWLAPERIWTVVGLAVVLRVLGHLFQARRRVFISSFVDFTGETASKTGEGLAARLADGLARLSNVYRIVDEARLNTGPASNAVDATINVDDAGQALQGAVSADLKVNLWLVQIPVGALLGLLNRVVQGPRLSGSVHKQGKTLVVAATLRGGGLSGDWRVTTADQEPPAPDPDADPLDWLIEQLTYRIFTELGNVGSPIWQAVRLYSEGLREYRSALRTDRDRRLKLQRAERKFIQALGQDNKFAPSHYNLGVIYKDLNKREAARIAFQYAVKENPRLARAYYALALNTAKSGGLDTDTENRLLDAMTECYQALRLQPLDAQTWDLRGLLQREETARRVAVGNPDPNGLSKCVESLEIAVALAWRKLSLEALSPSDADSPKDWNILRETARSATLHLAQALAKSHWGRSQMLFHQAIRLDPVNAELYAEQGKALSKRSAWSEARRRFRRALQVEDRPVFWAYQAVCRAGMANAARDALKQVRYRDEARLACRRAMSGAWDADKDTLEQAKTALEMLGEPADLQQASWVESTPAFKEWVERKPRETTQAFVSRLSGWGMFLYGRWPWAVAQMEIHLARLYLNGDPREGLDPFAWEIPRAAPPLPGQDAAAAQALLTAAQNKFAPAYPDEIKARGLYSLLALAYMAQGNLQDALDNAEKGVAMNPEGDQEHRVLAQVYSDLNDFQAAEAEWEISLNLKADYRTLHWLAKTYFDRARATYQPGERRRHFDNVIQYMTQGLANAESTPLEHDKSPFVLIERWRAHFWLGRFHREQTRYGDAIAHLRIAESLANAYCKKAEAERAMHPQDAASKRAEDELQVYMSLATLVHLGMALFRAKAYEVAEAKYKLALKQASKLQNSPLGAASGLCLSIEQHLLFALTWCPLSYVERGVYLERARRMVNAAVKRIPKRTPPDRRATLYSGTHFALGLIALREDRAADAVGHLEKSLTFESDAESYYYLALAYLQTVKDGGDRAQGLAKAREARDFARVADLREEFKDRLAKFDDDLLKIEVQKV